MSDPKAQIENELKEAMKAADKPRVSTLRMLLNDVKNEQIRAGEPVDNDSFIRIVRKAIKQRKEASDQFRKGDRIELAEKEESEAELLQAYLPPEISEEVIRAAIQEVITEQSLTAPAGMGVLMKAIMGRYPGQVDGSVVSRLARELLQPAS